MQHNSKMITDIGPILGRNKSPVVFDLIQNLKFKFSDTK